MHASPNTQKASNMDTLRWITTDLSYWFQKGKVVSGQAGEDGDFIQLRVVQERRKKAEESRKASLQHNDRESIFTRSDISHQRKSQGPTTASRANQIEEIRAQLFQATLNNNKEHKTVSLMKVAEKKQRQLLRKVMDLVGQAKQYEPLDKLRHPQTNENIWHFALSNGKNEIAKFLLGTVPDSLIISHHKIHRSGIQGNHNALHILTEKDDIRMAKSILSKIRSKKVKIQMMELETAVDIQGQRPRTLSCLHLAAYWGHAELVELFLAEGMDVNHKNKRKDTALLWAARWGHISIVKTLIDRGANPELKNDKGSTALHWAVRYEHSETVKLLLEKGKANPNTTRKLGLVAPLVVASAYGNNEIVKLLLAHPDCKVNIRIRGGEIPIHHAAREGCEDVMATLLEHGATLDDKDELGDTPLLLAAQNGHTELVYKLITLGANVNHRNHEGNDTWNHAIDKEKNDLLETLLSACKDNEIDMTNRQPLCIAASSGRYDKIEFLLNLKQDPSVCDRDGNTFLHHAAMNDKYEVIEKFNTSLPIDTQNKHGNTPLHVACSKGFHRTVRTLLKCKASAAIKNKEGETALHVAAYSKHITAETVRELVDYTIKMHDWESLNAIDYKGNNCLHVAGKFARPDVLWEFRFVRFKDRDNDGNTPLHEAVRPGEPGCLNMMLDIFETMKRDARINEQSYARSETVLHLAAEQGLSTCVKRLIDLGADLSNEDVDGNTVLHRITWATVLNPKQLKRHLEVFDTVLSGVVKWWCIKNSTAYPEKDNIAEYMRLRREACLYLFNEVHNKEGLSVLALSFQLGASDIIARLLMLQDVTMFEAANKEKDRHVLFDITGLMPHTNKALKGFCGCRKIAPRSDKTLHLSALELLITQKEKTRAAQILDLPPMKMIENYYTSIVAKTFAFLMLFHIIYMSIFTYVGVDLLGKLRDDPNAINSSDPETILLYIIVPIEPAIIVSYVAYRVIITVRSIISGEIKRKQKLSLKQHFKYVYNVIKLDPHAYVQQMVGVVYAALIIAWIVLFFVQYSHQDYVLAVALCIGWLLSIVFTRGIKRIHYFYRMLISMILKDVFRFIIVYLFVLLAFGFAFHVLFQISSAVVADYETPFDTLFLSFNMMIGMDELFDGVFENNMSAVGRTVVYLKVFYLLYIILSTIILLNLLIAMMNDSYSKIQREQQVTWRIDSVSLGVAIEKRFLESKSFSNFMNGTDAATHFYTTTPSSGLDIFIPDRWYVSIEGTLIDEYTCQKDIGRENTADGLSRRLDDLQMKSSEFQEKTTGKLQQMNALHFEFQKKTTGKLQQINALLEKMTEHR